MRCVDVGGVAVGALDRREWVEHLAGCVREGTPHHHLSLNASKWVARRADPTLHRAVEEATSIAADGASVVLASRWLGDPLPERVAGCDLAQDLLLRAATEGWAVYQLGGSQDVVDTVQSQLEARRVRIVGARDGFFAEHEERAVAEAVRAASPDLLLLALGTPKAELFVTRWGSAMQVPLAMGVGGTFDILAGRARRAPVLAQRIGLEGIWRFAGSPARRFRAAILDPARFFLGVARAQR